MIRNVSRLGMRLLGAGMFVAILGARCGIPIFDPGPVVETVRVELENDTDTPVNPNLFVDGILHLVDPPLAPFDMLPLDVDCFADTRLQTQADLLTGAGAIASDNDPYVDQGYEFYCGDTVRFAFAEDELGFFTAVFVNGFQIDAPTP